MKGGTCFWPLLVAACAAEPLEVRAQPFAALVVPHHLAEGDTGKTAATLTTKAPPPPAQGDLPDPPPLVALRQHEFTFHYLNGDIAIEGVKTIELARPRATVRRMGRFALELWIGKELLERVRFDFPLLGAAALPGEAIPGQPDLAVRADVVHVVTVPDSARATRAHLVDRATGEVVVLPWPPESFADPRPAAAK